MRHKSLSVWDVVEERFHKRLALWKIQYIFKGGRITLIHSMLVSMPLYIISLFRIPRAVSMRLENIQRVQDRVFSHILSVSPSRSKVQGSWGLGFDRRKIPKEAGCLEDTVYL